MRADPHTVERFAVLHDAADALLDELTDLYQVERRETKELLGPSEALVRMVRLIPRTPLAGPLAVAFTDLPALVVRLGRWWTEALPRSRADDPELVAAELRRKASALVEGGLWERARRSRFEARLIGVDIDAGREGLLTAQEWRAARRGGFAAPVQWAPWPTRA